MKSSAAKRRISGRLNGARCCRAEAQSGLTLSTIRGRLAAVRFFHRDEGEDDPTSPEMIENTLKNLARKAGTPAEQDCPPPMTLALATPGEIDYYRLENHWILLANLFWGPFGPSRVEWDRSFSPSRPADNVPTT